MHTVIEAQGVSKQFLLRHNASVELKVRFLGLLSPKYRESIEEFWALKNVSLQIARGQAVGLIGRNGSGKSTLLKLIAAIHRPTSGRLLVAKHSRISSMIELGVGFHPELTGRENVFLNAAIHGLTGEETEAIYRDIVSYSGLEHFIDVPIKNFSSGMYMRLGFAIAAMLAPDILLLDEIFAVGDADFQLRCLDTIKRFLDQGKTIVFVSHSPDAVRMICGRACVLDHGELAFDGDVENALYTYSRILYGERAIPRPPGYSIASHKRDFGRRTASSTLAIPASRRPNAGGPFSRRTISPGWSTMRRCSACPPTPACSMSRLPIRCSRSARSTRSRAASPASFGSSRRMVAFTPPGSRIPTRRILTRSFSRMASLRFRIRSPTTIRWR